MNLHRPSPSMESSSSSADFSSPALPELSLDASLQRLHREEDTSISSSSSVALSRAWLRNRQQLNLEHRASSPENPSLYSHTSEAFSSIHNSTFRFPPLQPSQSQSLSSEDPSVIRHEDPVLPARPRTSRGLSQHKPFLSSSSRSTSIASIAQVEQHQNHDLGPRIVFGTPFAGNAFDEFPAHHSNDAQLFRRHSDSSASAVSPRQPYAAFSAKKEESKPRRRLSRDEAQRPHASPPSRSELKLSPWTVLLAPLSKGHNSDDVSVQDTHETILLPLQPSIERQIHCLKSQLVTNPSSDAHLSLDGNVEFFLDLSSVSALPANTMVRLTPDTWSLTFDRFCRSNADSAATKMGEAPLPYLCRETGLPIVALVRYNFTQLSHFDGFSSKLSSKSHDAVSTLREASSASSRLETHDSNPWNRRESEKTVSLANTGRLGVSPGMVPSRSYPGAPRTPVRKSPLPYSPRTRSFPRDATRPLVTAALAPIGSPMTYSHLHQALGTGSAADANKLRSLSLAAVHPLSATEDRPSDIRSPASNTPSRVVSGLPSGISTRHDNEEPPTSRRDASPIRQRYQSSRGSSHKSFPLHTTSLSTHSPRSTSIYSSRSRLRPGSQQEGHDSDADTEEDNDVGSRFWTQLSSLGEQVSHENKDVQGIIGTGRARNVSVSSTASDASVFDFSPLGILVPTEEVNDVEVCIRESTQDTRSLNVSPTSLSVAGGTESGILGRRRAYSSMIPLTGWRAGDSDLSTAEGQRVASARELPQVLLLHARDDPRGNDVHGLDSTDLVTPTVSTFQGRARAQSFQSGSTSFHPSLDTSTALGGLSTQRQEVWEEAMYTLTDLLAQSRRQISEEPPTLEHDEAQTFPRMNLDIDTGGAYEQESSEQVIEGTIEDPTTAGVDTWPPSIQSSPLPGLFYDNWVERVEVSIDGDLGRRGSTLQSSPDVGKSEVPPLQAGLHQTNPEASGGMTRTSSASSTSTMLGSAGSVSSLQVMHESEWPLPQSRSLVERVSADDTMLSASHSFLSVCSPREPDARSEDSANGDNDRQDHDPRLSNSRDRIIVGSSAAEEAQAPPASIPRIAEASLDEINLTQPIRESVSSTGALISSWADLAQRLESPGSMRLLCFAAANWAPRQSCAAQGLARAQDGRKETSFATGLTVPLTAVTSSLSRSRSMSEVDRPGGMQEKEAQIREPAVHGEEERERLMRRKAALLEPIVNPTQADLFRQHEESAEGFAPKAVTRVKRSLSNIFDLASPVDSRTCES